MKQQSPPTLAFCILEAVVPVSQREAMLGDLLEEFALQQETGSPRIASRWLWAQTWRSVLFLTWSALRTEWLLNICIAAGVYALMAIVELAAGFVAGRLSASTPTNIVLEPVVFLAITALGGWIAARIRDRATLSLALIVLVTVAALSHIKICPIPVPSWYRFAFLAGGQLSMLIAPAMFRLNRRPVTGIDLA